MEKDNSKSFILYHSSFIIVLILSFLGFLDSTYLTIQHYKNIIPPCSIARGCEKVLTSQFATVFGIPTALLGVIFYICAILLLILFLQTRKFLLLTSYFLLLTCGALISLILIYIQVFVLHAICQYCMVSDAITIILFIIILLWRKQFNNLTIQQ